LVFGGGVNDYIDGYGAYREGFNFGLGVLSADRDPRDLAVTGTVNQAPGIGSIGHIHLTRVQTMEELENHLGIDAEASAGIGLFSASARFKFAVDSKVQTLSLTLIVTGEVAQGMAADRRARADDGCRYRGRKP
jgi:hypothetical protein